MNRMDNLQGSCKIRQYSRKRKKHNKTAPRILFLVMSCFVFFMLGQVFMNVSQAHSSSEIVRVTRDNTNIKLCKTSDKNEFNGVNGGLNSRNDWNLILVNPWNKVPEKFKNELTKLKNGQCVDKRIYPELQDMLNAARAESLAPVICSSFRTMEKQQSLFNHQVNKYVARGYSPEQARNEAAKWVAVPGTSEHQTGLAVDIVATRYQSLDRKQEETAEQQWLMKNCYKYGFILRYPENKSNLTGISYEPWHYRYVGKEAAKQIMEKGICLEEYLKDN